MGNVNASYKQRRGANEAGTDIVNGKDYFSGMCDSGSQDFENMKALYDTLDAGKQAEFKAIFDGDDVMRDRTALESWMNEAEDEDMDGVLAQIKSKFHQE